MQLESSIIRTDEINTRFGEMHPLSANKIIQYARMTHCDRFMDLGAGCGHFMLQVAKYSSCHSIFGLEIVPEFCKVAQQVLRSYSSALRKINCREGNFFKEDWEAPTVVYCCSEAFQAPMLDKLAWEINSYPSVKQVFTLRPLKLDSRYRLRRYFRVHCSWASAMCYHYILG